MTTAIMLKDLEDWAKEKLCSEIKFKQPVQPNESMDGDYNYKIVNPNVFVMYIPKEDQLPDGVESVFPNLCIEWDGDRESPQSHKGEATIRLKLGVWNPGDHKGDYVSVKPDNTPDFKRNAKGYEDIINWIDLIKRELRNNELICGKYRVKLESDILSGTPSEQRSLLDFNPYYFGYVEFSIEYESIQNKFFNELL